MHGRSQLKALEAAHTALKFGFIGIEGFDDRIFRLKPAQIAALLGPAASTSDANSLDVSTLRVLANELAVAADAIDFSSLDLRPVPPDKLIYNNLPNHWKLLIAGGWKNAHLVSAYFNRHPDPMTGEKVAKLFKDRYAYLKLQNLQSGDIMAALFELVTGIGSVPPKTQVAAQALLAFLFENCDIFDREPTALST